MATKTELKELRRPELDELATKQGLNPEDYSNKDEIAGALAEAGVELESNEEEAASNDENKTEVPVATQTKSAPDRYQQNKLRGRNGKSVGAKEVKKSRDSATNLGMDPKKSKKSKK